MIRRPAILVILIVLALSSAVALAQTGGGYDLSWSTVDGGGGTSSGGTFSLSGTVGQPDASTAMTGGTYTLRGGFWAGIAPEYNIDLPIVIR